MINPRLDEWRQAAVVQTAGLGWLFAVLVSVALVSLTASTPWLGYGLRSIVEQAFQSLCHQQADRSFQVGGTPFAVCHRCFGIYTGVALGIMMRPLVRRLRAGLSNHAIPIVAAALILLALDWGLDVAGIWENTVLSRALTGLIVGSIGGMYLGVALLPDERIRPKSTLVTVTLP